MSRLEILQNSLAKKNAVVDAKISNHFATVAQANGQPLNDKRNGAATFKKQRLMFSHITELAGDNRIRFLSTAKKLANKLNPDEV